MPAKTLVSLASFLEAHPMKTLLALPQEDLDQVMGAAYQLYQAGRYGEAEILCRGLIAADHRYWWCYSLYAAVLRRQGRLREAIHMLDLGLRYEPDQPKLLAMREETERCLSALTAKIAEARARKSALSTQNLGPAHAVAPEVSR